MPTLEPPTEGVKTPPASQTLYRFWDARDQLLYVGISVRPWDRWKQHRGEKPWWEEVVRVTLENYPSREAVRAAEMSAIRTESPRYNIQGRTEAPDSDPWEDANAYWNGVHEPYPACIGSLLGCSCREPAWGDPRASNVPCGSQELGHNQDDCGACRSASAEWLAEQPFYQPEDYAAHVIESVLGERFAVALQSPQPTVRRKPSVKFVADMWPASMEHDLPRRWKAYAREWLDGGLTRDEVREAVAVALDAWTAGRTDRPWAYLSGITRRMLSEREVG